MGGLADRMKAYESAASAAFPPNSVVVARVDGRGFSKWTSKATKPFDDIIERSMVAATRGVMSDIPGHVCAYHQSDEATFVFTDMLERDHDLWFGGKRSKLDSVIASSFTAWFNWVIAGHVERQTPKVWAPPHPAQFDCRTFVVPPADAPNVVVWRQRDWERNSVQMLARSLFPQSALHGVNQDGMRTMLSEVGADWDAIEPRWQHGSFMRRGSGDIIQARLDYDIIAGLTAVTDLTP